jgi:hypothetical protein
MGMLVIAAVVYAAEGGAPGWGDVAGGNNNSCDCKGPVCQGQGQGCYQCGTILCECNCMSGVAYSELPNLSGQPCI